MDNQSCIPTQVLLLSAYRYTMVAECIVACLAIPPNLALLLVIWRVSVFSKNLRLLLAHFSCILLWFALGDIVKSVHILAVSQCGYPMSIRNCKIFDLCCTSLPLGNMLYSFLGVCVYRLYASLRYRKYDSSSQDKPWVGAILIVLSWLVTLAVNVGDISSLSTEQYLPICANTVATSSRVTIVFYIYLAFEILATIAVAFVFFYTQHIARHMSINRALFDLSSRFQIDQNVRVNAVIIPSLILHIIGHIPVFILLSGLAGDWDMDFETRPWFTRITYLLRLVYAFAHPVLAFYKNFNLKNNLVKLTLGCARCAKTEKDQGTPVTRAWVVSEQTHHFNHLDKFWADKRREIDNKKAKSGGHKIPPKP